MKSVTTLPKGIKNEFVSIACTQIIVLSAVAYLNLIHKGISEIRTHGPIPILINVFLPPIALTVILIMIGMLISTSRAYKLAILFISYGFRLLMPYLVFSFHVNYDTPYHYLSSLYLRDIGYSNKYLYHNWPHSLVLAGAFNLITGLEYPLDASIIAIVARMAVPLLVYVVGKNIFRLKNDSLYATLMTLVVFEPFIIHFCPQIIAVSLILYCFMVSLKMSGTKLSSIITFFVLFIALLFTHGMFPISMTLYIVILLIIKILENLSSNRIFSLSNNGTLTKLMITPLLLVLVYNIFITTFVTKDIIETMHMLLTGDFVRLDVYNPLIDEPHIQQQYMIIRLANLIITSSLLGPVALYASVKFIYYFFNRSEHDVIERPFVQLFTFVMMNFLLFAVFDRILGTGLVERYYQVSVISATLLLGIFYQNVISTSATPHLRMFSKVFSYTLPIMIVISIITTPAYVTLFRWPYTYNELEMARFASSHILGRVITMTGDLRLIQQVELDLYLNGAFDMEISRSNVMDINCLYQKYSYPQGTIVLLNRITIFKTSSISGLSLNMLRSCIENMNNYLDKVYDDNFNALYYA